MKSFMHTKENKNSQYDTHKPAHGFCAVSDMDHCAWKDVECFLSCVVLMSCVCETLVLLATVLMLAQQSKVNKQMHHHLALASSLCHLPVEYCR